MNAVADKPKKEIVIELSCYSCNNEFILSELELFPSLKVWNDGIARPVCKDCRLDWDAEKKA